MSKKDKLLAKLYSKPSPKSFSWEDLITLMIRAGFDNRCEGGSHYMFEHSTGRLVGLSKTHPSGILKAYQVKVVKEALASVGESQEKNDGDK